MQQVVSMPQCSAGGSLTHPYTIRTGSTPIGTFPTIRTRTFSNVQSSQFKSTPNTIQKREGTGFPSVSNMEEFIHPQPQHALCLQISGISYPNFGMSKDSDL